MAITLGYIRLIGTTGLTILIPTRLKPLCPCTVTIGGATYKATHACDWRGALQLTLAGSGTPAVGAAVTVDDSHAIETLHEYGPAAANVGALQALIAAARPHKIKVLVTGTAVFQYSDGTGVGFGNGWWIRITA
jgi:hypothetical protein